MHDGDASDAVVGVHTVEKFLHIRVLVVFSSIQSDVEQTLLKHAQVL